MGESTLAPGKIPVAWNQSLMVDVSTRARKRCDLAGIAPTCAVGGSKHWITTGRFIPKCDKIIRCQENATVIIGLQRSLFNPRLSASYRGTFFQ
jgi:hypothetical protein